MITGINIFGALSVIFSLLLLRARVSDYLHTDELGMFGAAYFIAELCWLVCGAGVIKRLSWARIGLIILALIYIVDTLEYPSSLFAGVKHYGKGYLIIPMTGLFFLISLIVYFTRASVKQFFDKK